MLLLKKLIRVSIISFVLLAFIFTTLFYFSPVSRTWFTSHFTSYTVESRVAQYEKDAEKRLTPFFTKRNINYPPSRVKLLFLKDEKTLNLYAGNSSSDLTLIKKYEVQAASGNAGPKLREGDNQVPEGVYKIESLNPNSRYHLSLRLNYPNSFDQEKAKLEGRTTLGGDIMIHGKNVSIGCIAIGDENIEELFILAAKSNYQNWEVISAPTNLKVKSRTKNDRSPPWLDELDTLIKENYPD